MQRYIIFLGSLLLLYISSPLQALGATLREELFSSIVQITAISETGEVMGGSGTTISKDGLILTNYHVITDAKTDLPFSTLTLCYNISQYEPPRCAASGKIVARIKEYDLALIRPDKKIDKNGVVTAASFSRYWKNSGNSFYAVPFKNPKTGILPAILDPITAWGYPIVGGSTVTVTRGTVSGFALEGDGENRIVKFIKTDVYINPGNSGGAAFDEYFSFIGVPSNAYTGQLGFIIPVNTVVEWMQYLEKKGILATANIDSVATMNFAYSDISENDHLQNIALLLRHLGIMNGFDDGTFKPDALLTEAEALVSLVAAKRMNSNSTHYPMCSHSKGSWYARALCYSSNAGWIDEKKFHPDKTITEKEFRILMKKAFMTHSPYRGSADPITRAQAAYAFSELIIP